MRLIDIIVPTWNNPEFLNPCVESIASTGILRDMARLLIVNNGNQNVEAFVNKTPNVEVLKPGQNLGWERGLKFGLGHSDAPFVVFQNDDTHIPAANSNFYLQLLRNFEDPAVAAVGPTTTVAAGWHSIFRHPALHSAHYVPFLIFFTVMIRRGHYDAVDGIDADCPGGDDIDLSMRLRQAGKKLIVDPRAFLIHHGFKSGTRLRGDHTVKGGWNSQEMQDETNRWLIRKHGFMQFIGTMQSTAEPIGLAHEAIDREGDTVREYVRDADEKILELGCGFRKTVERAVGVDRVARGEEIPHVRGSGSVADVEADVSQKLPFPDNSQDLVIARHILEHCVDSVETLRNWNRVLKIGGRLLVAVPNQELGNTIPMNPEHVHAFTPTALQNLLEQMGFKHVATGDPKNGVSFVGCYEKVLHMAPVSTEALTHA